MTVAIGDCRVDSELIRKYIFLCFEPSGDLEVYEFMRSELHNQIRESAPLGSWGEPEEKELSIILEKSLSCPVCGVVPITRPRNCCKKCNRHITKEDVEEKLKELCIEDEALPLDQEYLAAGYPWGP